jgi:hypothetical protein
MEDLAAPESARGVAMSRGLSRKQHHILWALAHAPAGTWQDLWLLAHWCHGCLSDEEWIDRSDPCRARLTRGEQSSIARAIRSLQKRGLIRVTMKRDRYGRGFERVSPRGRDYTHTIPVRWKAVQLSVAYEVKFPRGQRLQETP